MRNYGGFIRGLAFFIFFCFLLISCQNQDISLSEKTGNASGLYAGKEIVFLTVETTLPFWKHYTLALNDLAKNLGIKTSTIGPETWDLDAEITMLYELAKKKPTGILLFAADDNPKLAKAINDVVDQGVPIINLIQEVSNSKRLTRIGIDNYKAGRAGGEALGKAVGGSGKVLIGETDSAIFHERSRGYKDVLKEKYPNIQVVEMVDDKVDPTEGPKKYLEALKRHPDVVGIGGTDAESGKAAARAVIELGLTGKIKIIGMDRDDKMLAYLKDGTITGSVAQKSYFDAAMGAKMLLDYETGLNVTDMKNNNLKIYPDDIDSGVWIINKDNVDAFLNK
jgi:ribose transport system substrate-binding protein